ncbi:MAG: endonuclease III domain-containing protein [Candidatus Cloacimonetes bacterium]|nr:endonuclease III domain-containing protein [Candidatus Cloacimonadota bacterium]
MSANQTPQLYAIYNILLKKFGPQHWWPGESKEEIIIGAILTQNTNWKNVEKSIYNLKSNNLIDLSRLDEIDEQKLAEIIHSSGYYKQKAKRLKLVAEFFKKNPISTLENCSTGELRETLLSVNGIGAETADSILLYAFNRPIFVIDAYTKRIFNRLGFWNEKISYKDAQDLFMNNLNPSDGFASGGDVNLFNEYHALLVKLGKDICKKTPLCPQCPLKSVCVSDTNY